MDDGDAGRYTYYRQATPISHDECGEGLRCEDLQRPSLTGNAMRGWCAVATSVGCRGVGNIWAEFWES